MVSLSTSALRTIWIWLIGKSMHYQMLKHTGELLIIGVNTFRNPKGDEVMDTGTGPRCSNACSKP